ncbi:MAG: endolytic transglycosylase MltG [Gemmatimonadaceae bacterium]|jgi:UPF0755 protein|nr:endolytic transglycosylase MltG [Gemmatimonadaceae bacterium]
MSARVLRRAIAAAAVGALAACGGGAGGSPERVVIPAGASLRAVADSLEARGIVTSASAFRMWAASGGRDRAIKPGTYEFARGAEWSEILDALVKGRGVVATVVIPEGWAISEIAPALAKALDVPVDSVRAAVADSALRETLDVPTPTLEGYLFPATYEFPAGTSARAAIRAMVRRFEQAWRPEWDATIARAKRTRHQVVTMAAIVEKEARVADERPTIAAVYWNRVAKGMRLQADPTVQYAMGAHVERVLYKHLETESPYNTYKVAGLPPGPIASPGAASLAAAVAPADAPWLYFVAHPDGHHEFRRTFAEHQAAIREVRRAARTTDGAR